jgi:UDP-N-acetylglucosamine 2-epimerase (non-hydrolysing)
MGLHGGDITLDLPALSPETLVIAVILGTTAELIKSTPVIRTLADRGNEIEIWNTAMHAADLDETLDRLVPDVPVRHLSNPKRDTDIASALQIPRWFTEVGMSAWRQRSLLRSILDDGADSIVLVHGDTLTTVLGALIGRMLRVQVGHIEAGYTSGSLLQPFPEEIDRRLAARIATVHFAPGPREVENLSSSRGLVVDTGENTAIDALRMFMNRSPADEERYGIVTLHRFELMRKPGALRPVLEACREAAEERPILFLTGPHGRARLAEHRLNGMFDDRFRMIERLPYPDFVPLLANAEFVLTDSGGLQLETSYLGLPCLIHRERFESNAGLGRNVVVSGLDFAVVRDFLADPSRWRAPSMLDSAHPTEIIVDTLVELGLAR